jgi:methylated-DNA-[protein]-cysteine S-methyltransferase
MQAAAQLTQYFAGQRRVFEVPLDLGTGTPFQQRVWRVLLAIAPGTTRSYAQVSIEIGQPTAVRAVAGAVGRNPLGIIIPCHRVLGSDGTLTGYAGGLPRKRALLRLEGASYSISDQQGMF